VIAEAGDLSSVVRYVHGHQPHVLVLDLGMPNGSSIETIRRACSLRPPTGLRRDKVEVALPTPIQ
jgi:DNA-binding NarL/FixJ family response regulator